MKIKSFRLLFLSFFISLLTGCGGGGGGGVTPVPVPIPPVNQAPSFTSATEFSFAENEVVSFFVSVNDPDGDTVTISDAGTGDGGVFQLNAGTGEVTALTDNGVFNFENPLDGDKDNVYIQNFTLNDGTTTVTATVSVTITNVVEPPSYLGSTNFEADEGVVGFAISATDNDSTVLDYTLGGADADRFVIQEGSLNFVDLADFENPADVDANNVYEVVLSIANSEAEIDVNLTATINNVDESPICNGPETFSFAENVSGEIYRFSATDPEGDSFSFENFVITAENLLFNNITIDPATGAVLLTETIDFEALADPRGQLSVSAGDTICNAEFTVTNISGIATSGLKLLGRATNIEPVGDVDGDGTRDLWLSSQVEDELTGILVFGDYLAAAMPAATLDTNTAAANKVLPIRLSASNAVGGATKTLIARAVGDIDGDNIDELLVGFTLCEGCVAERDMAYLIWGSTIQNNVASILTLDELNADQVLRLPFQSQASTRLSFASGDFDGDGRSDLAFGMPTPVEASFVIFGDFLAQAKSSGSIDLTSATQTQVLDFNIDYMSLPFAGEDMTTIVDIDGDTFPELVMTSSQWVQVVHSSTISEGRAANSLNLGSSFDVEINATFGVGALNQQQYDLEGDGLPEIAWTQPAGELANVAVGSTLADAPNTKSVDDTANNVSANAISSISDMTGGGYSELVLSLRTSVEPELNQIFVITGEVLDEVDLGFFVDLSTSAPSELLSISGITPLDKLTSSVASFADLDGDGLEELIVSDVARGEIYVIRGVDISDALQAGESELDMNALFNAE